MCELHRMTRSRIHCTLHGVSSEFALPSPQSHRSSRHVGDDTRGSPIFTDTLYRRDDCVRAPFVCSDLRSSSMTFWTKMARSFTIAGTLVVLLEPTAAATPLI